ncbi:MAG: helix-turn-helix domain-containing protein [bacterium]|nr:helix-turn-helix domain-containing protein [bacterium]
MTFHNKNDFDHVWNRIKESTDLNNFTQLSEIIGITQGGVSRAKKRNDFPANWAYSLAKRYGLLTEWIMTGEGPKRIKDQSAPQAKPEAAFLMELEAWAREISGTNNLKWLENQIESQFPAFRSWREEKKNKENAEADQVAYKLAQNG